MLVVKRTPTATLLKMARLEAQAIVDMLSDLDSDMPSVENSGNELGEPICPGSDDELPLFDRNDHSS